MITISNIEPTDFRGVYALTLEINLANQVTIPNVMITRTKNKIEISDGSLIILKTFLQTQTNDEQAIISTITQRASELLSH